MGTKNVLRALSHIPGTRVMSQEVQGETSGAERAEKLLSEGYGIIVVVPHYAFRDFLENMNYIAEQEEMKGRQIDIPLAKHQYDNPLLNIFARFARAKYNVNQHPVITDRTKDKTLYRETLIGKVMRKIGPVKSAPEVKELVKS